MNPGVPSSGVGTDAARRREEARRCPRRGRPGVRAMANHLRGWARVGHQSLQRLPTSTSGCQDNYPSGLHHGTMAPVVAGPWGRGPSPAIHAVRLLQPAVPVSAGFTAPFGPISVQARGAPCDSRLFHCFMSHGVGDMTHPLLVLAPLFVAPFSFPNGHRWFLSAMPQAWREEASTDPGRR